MKMLAGGLGFVVGLGQFISLSKQSAAEAENAINTEERLRATLIATGNATGFTADKLVKMSGELMKTMGVTDEEVQGAMGRLSMFGSVTGDTFEKTLKAAVNLSKMGFGSVEGAARTLGMALEDPIRGMSRLRRMGIMLTGEQQQYVKTLAAGGDTKGAQAAMLELITRKVGGLAEAMAKTPAGKLAAARIELGELREEMGKELLPTFQKMLDLQISFQRSLNTTIATVTKWVEEHKYLIEALVKIAAGYVGVKATIWGAKQAAEALSLASKGAAFVYEAAGGGGGTVSASADFGSKVAASAGGNLLASGIKSGLTRAAVGATTSGAAASGAVGLAGAWGNYAPGMAAGTASAVGNPQASANLARTWGLIASDSAVATTNVGAMNTFAASTATKTTGIWAAMQGVQITGMALVGSLILIGAGVAYVLKLTYDLWAAWRNYEDEVAKGKVLDEQIKQVVEANKKMVAEEDRAVKEKQRIRESAMRTLEDPNATKQEKLAAEKTVFGQFTPSSEGWGGKFGDRKERSTKEGEKAISDLRRQISLAGHESTMFERTMGVTFSDKTRQKVLELTQDLKLTGVELATATREAMRLAAVERIEWIKDLEKDIIALENRWTDADIAYQRYLKDNPDATKSEKENVRGLLMRKENASVVKDLEDQSDLLDDIEAGYDGIESKVQVYARANRRASEEQLEAYRQNLRDEHRLKEAQQDRINLVLKYRSGPSNQTEAEALRQQERGVGQALNEKYRTPMYRGRELELPAQFQSDPLGKAAETWRQSSAEFLDKLTELEELRQRNIDTGGKEGIDGETFTRAAAEIRRGYLEAQQPAVTGITSPLEYGKRIQEMILQGGAQQLAQQQLNELININAGVGGDGGALGKQVGEVKTALQRQNLGLGL